MSDSPPSFVILDNDEFVIYYTPTQPVILSQPSAPLQQLINDINNEDISTIQPRILFNDSDDEDTIEDTLEEEIEDNEEDNNQIPFNNIISFVTNRDFLGLNLVEKFLELNIQEWLFQELFDLMYVDYIKYNVDLLVYNEYWNNNRWHNVNYRRAQVFFDTDLSRLMRHPTSIVNGKMVFYFHTYYETALERHHKNLLKRYVYIHAMIDSNQSVNFNKIAPLFINYDDDALFNLFFVNSFETLQSRYSGMNINNNFTDAITVQLTALDPSVEGRQLSPNYINNESYLYDPFLETMYYALEA
jgi:hypothetical protein